MADPICRWHNPNLDTVYELINFLPKKEMTSTAFREVMQNYYNGKFFRTPYQTACQLGLYFEDSDKYTPRFKNEPKLIEIVSYLQNWLIKYPVPNPFTKQGFKDLQPVSIHSELSRLLFENPEGLNWNDVKNGIFKEEIGNDDILVNTINSYSDLFNIKNNRITLKDGVDKDDLINFIFTTSFTDRNDKKAFFDLFSENDYYPPPSIRRSLISILPQDEQSDLLKYISIKTKPFIILAGLSGTGKSRLVRTLAYKFDNIESDKSTPNHPPSNFQLIKVKPNWHDSAELLGYESRISGKDRFIVTEFIRFIVKAWLSPDTPFFLCLDEMNLAPVEQYFAEYLSVIETRRVNTNGIITTDSLISGSLFSKYANKAGGVDPAFDIWAELELTDTAIQEKLKSDGLGIPSNFIVMGTVNMDETTHSFSRKVLDRAMTIEMNDINLSKGLNESHQDWSYPESSLQKELVISEKTQGGEVYSDLAVFGNEIIDYLDKINDKMEGSPFTVAYRVRDEFLLFAFNYSLIESKPENWLNSVLDEMTLMKILPRIEGDEDRTKLLEVLIPFFEEKNLTKSLNKANEMENRRKLFHYTSFWS